MLSSEPAPFNAQRLAIPARWPQRLLVNENRTAKEGSVRPVITSSKFSERFARLAGGRAETFVLSTRIFELETRSSDDILARDVESGLPLLVSRDEHLIVNFDIPATRAFQFADSKRPLYTYVPGFDIHQVPEWLKRPLSNFVKSLRAGKKIDVVQKYSTLPLTSFECALLLITTASASIDCRLFRWPSGKSSVFLSLHDIDTAGFLERKENDPLFRVEQKHGIRSCWFVPTKILGRDERAVDFLKEAGHEVGWHGHKHDHRDHVGRFADAAVDALKRSCLNVSANFPTGMRAPRLLKSHYLFAQLERSCAMLQYDTSFLNGIVPYPLWVNGRPSTILEIPTTVPTDILLYNQLRGVPAERRSSAMLRAQIARTEKLRALGGVISIVTHPEKGLSERPDFLRVYDEYLGYICSASDVWFTTAGELFKYWTSLDTSSTVSPRTQRALAQATAS
jgi:peptidoglycan/xylan/chitin deacetylase (PgdA/CDA1 family)